MRYELNCKEKIEYNAKIKEEIISRIVYLEKEIEGLESIENVTDIIIKKNVEDKDIPFENRIPISILISTNGGQLKAAKFLINLINGSKTPINTVCISNTYSAGGLILVSGHKRYMYKNSIFHIHDLSSGTFGKLTDMEEMLKDIKIYRKWMEEIYDERSRIPKNIMDDIMNNKREVVFNFKQCLKYHIVDDIIEDFMDIYK